MLFFLRREVVPGMSPSQVDFLNFTEVERRINENVWYPRPPPKFKFHIGDLLTIKFAALKERQLSANFGNKKSLSGFDSSRALVVQSRKTKAMGRKGAGLAPYYSGKFSSLSGFFGAKKSLRKNVNTSI